MSPKYFKFHFKFDVPTIKKNPRFLLDLKHGLHFLINTPNSYIFYFLVKHFPNRVKNFLSDNEQLCHNLLTNVLYSEDPISYVCLTHSGFPSETEFMWRDLFFPRDMTLVIE